MALELFQSLKCLCTDLDEVDIHLIVSDSREAAEWKKREAKLEPCGERWSRFDVPSHNVGRKNPKINVVNLFDILPPLLKVSSDVNASDTSAILRDRGKYAYQSIKKLMAAIHMDFDWGLWLDSEAIAVQPFSMREVFDAFIETPVIWKSRMSSDDGMRDWMSRAARTLGRSLDSFGPSTWFLERLAPWIFLFM